MRTYRDRRGHTQTGTTAPTSKRRPHRTSRPRRDPGPPPGPAQPNRSRLGPTRGSRGCNLAPTAKRGNRATCERLARSLCARAHATAGAQHAPRTPPALVCALAPSPAHTTHAQQQLRAVTGPPGGPQPSCGGPLGARWQRRVGIKPCETEATRGVSVEGDVGARSACHGGGCGALWRRLGTVSVRARAVRLQHAHLTGGAWAVGGEAGGGAGGVGSEAGEVDRRAAAVGAAVEPHERTCEARRVL